MNKCKSLRFPAEWEYNCAVLLAWPHENTDWNYMIDEVNQCYAVLVKEIVKFHPVIIISPDTANIKHHFTEEENRNIKFINIPTNDTWTRDYGPLSIENNGSHQLLDFCFNGWGMKFAADKDNLVNTNLQDIQLFSAPLINCRDFVFEGGGIESDGNGTLMTTSLCQLSPNRNATFTRLDIENRLKNILGANNLIWVDHGYLAGDDTDSHIDTLARFAPNSTIVYVGCNNTEDEHFEELSLMKEDLLNARRADGMPFNLIELPFPDPIYDEDGERLPATYANFLATNKAIFMPTYGQSQKDELAKQLLEVAFERQVITIDCRALIKQHGSLHCATMQIPIQALSL